LQPWAIAAQLLAVGLNAVSDVVFEDRLNGINFFKRGRSNCASNCRDDLPYVATRIQLNAYF
jgi:hypothetical protein